jgi:glutamine synthetase
MKDMFRNAAEVIQFIQENGIQMVDFKMVDIGGTFRHVTIPASRFSEKVLEDGIGFDASNYGYAVVEKSDMVFIPDLSTAMADPFCSVPTLSISGNAMIIGYPDNRPLPQYPRNIALAASQYLKDTGIADTMLILPEFEFYLFDEAGWKLEGKRQEAHVDFARAHWNSETEGTGNVVPLQKHYHVAKPYDTSYECRSEMVLRIEEAGIPVNYHHPEVSAGGQFEIEPLLGEMVKMADATVMIKYIIKNTAQKYGKCATFMPKPVYGEAGSGMHVHMLLMKDGKPVFSDDEGYAHLSQTAHYFMGGLLKHIDSLCALTNPSTNSYKRLIPGFEAPVTAGYATSNRSAVIRIPAYVKTPDMRRFELRNPDATCNPYLAYAAILMAGLDGVKNQIDPHENGWGPFDMNLYNLPDEEKAKLKSLPVSLDRALDALEKDHDYLMAGGVFPEDMIRSYIRSKRLECAEMSKIPTVPEFVRYFNC